MSDENEKPPTEQVGIEKTSCGWKALILPSSAAVADVSRAQNGGYDVFATGRAGDPGRKVAKLYERNDGWEAEWVIPQAPELAQRYDTGEDAVRAVVRAILQQRG